MIEVPVWRLFDVFGDSAELRDIVELIKEFRTPVFMSGRAVYIGVRGKLVRVTWKDGELRGWRDPIDVRKDIESIINGED